MGVPEISVLFWMAALAGQSFTVEPPAPKPIIHCVEVEGMFPPLGYEPCRRT